MDSYKKKIDEIHAPESLIEATLNRIHEEEKSQSGIQNTVQAGNGEKKANAEQKNSVDKRVVSIGSRRNKWMGATTFAVAAAAVVIMMGVNSGSGAEVNLVYNTVPESIVKTITGDEAEDTMDVTTYSEYLGLNIQKPTENATLIKSDISIRYEDEAVKADEGTLYYNVNGEQMMIRFSKTMSMVPDNLAEGEWSELEGQKLLVGESENGKERMAAFECNGVNCFLFSNSMEQSTFEGFLTDFLQNIK